jgi:hypothetical protein
MVIIMDFKENIKVRVGNDVTQYEHFHLKQVCCLGFHVTYLDENGLKKELYYDTFSRNLSKDADVVTYNLDQVNRFFFFRLVLFLAFAETRIC